MTIFTIDQDKCRKDGICAAVCPFGIIDIEAGKSFPKPSGDAHEHCITCGHCSAVCPHQALCLTELNPASMQPTDNSLLPSSANIAHLIRARRSIRSYKDQTVPRDTLERLIRLARYAPTARNSQLLKWLVFDSGEQLLKLKQLIIDWIEESVRKKEPSAAAYGFQNVLDAWEQGNDPILRQAPGLVVLCAPSMYPLGTVDSTIAMTTFELAASAEQLGTCWAGFFMIAAKQWPPLQEALRLPKGYAITTALMVGYPKYRYPRQPERNAPEISWR